MKALLKKELAEVLVPFGPVLVVVTVVWLLNATFWETLLPPAENALSLSALAAGVAGLVLGCLQFGGEAWRGRTAYLWHRGTGIDGAFLAKSVVGLLAAFAFGFVPPLVYALGSLATSPNAPIVEWSLLAAYARAATVGASAYGLGALTVGLRRKAIGAWLLLPFGIGGECVLFLLTGPPWAGTPAAWVFPTIHLGLGAILLAGARTLQRAAIDPDRRLPAGAHLVALALAIPLLFVPLEWLTLLGRLSAIGRVQAEYPVLVRDRESGEFLSVAPTPPGGYRRILPDGRLGERVDYGGSYDPSSACDTVVRVYPGSLHLASGLPEVPVTARLARRQGNLVLIGSGVLHPGDWTSMYRAYLDVERGTVRVWGIRSRGGPGVEGPDAPLRPFAIDLERPDTRSRFSPSTVVIWSNREVRPWNVRSEYLPHQTEPESIPLACLLDTADGTFWTFDPLDESRPIRAVPLPGDDRFVRLAPLYRRKDAMFGHRTESWIDPVVVGEHGTYTWDGKAFVDPSPSEDYVTAEEAPSIQIARVVVEDDDVLEPGVRVLDAKTDREIAAWRFHPRTTTGSVLARLVEGTALLRAPLANALVFSGIVQTTPGVLMLPFDRLFSGGRRPGLLLLDVTLALVCAVVCARMLSRRRAPLLVLGVWTTFVLAAGPVALFLAWVLEPRQKAFAPTASVALAEPEAELAIQSG